MIEENSNVTWGDIQVEALAKMFLNKLPFTVKDLPSFRTNKTYSTYLARMPFVANEGINIILRRGVVLLNNVILSDKMVVNNPDIDNDLYCFDMSKSDINFKSIHSIQINDKTYNNYTIKMNKYLYIPKRIVDNNVVNVIFRTYITPITSETDDDDFIENLPYEVAMLLPTYMASELYKDDDLALSTVYRNQFEVELEALVRLDNDDEFTDTKGWL